MTKRASLTAPRPHYIYIAQSHSLSLSICTCILKDSEYQKQLILANDDVKPKPSEFLSYIHYQNGCILTKYCRDNLERVKIKVVSCSSS